MGTPVFAVPSLTAVAEAHDVVAVYSRPDAVSGRGGETRPSPVKQAALELGLEVRMPATLRDPAEHDALRHLEPDIGVVAAYGMILPAEVLAVPAHGFVNVHASLLPRWRGAAPIQRAILAGDDVTGVSIMRMEEGLDTGPFCEAVETPIADKTAEQLTEELSVLGAQALVLTLERVEAGTCHWQAQDDAGATYAEKVTKEDVRLSPDLPATELVRRVKASTRQAPARLVVAGHVLTASRAVASDADVPPSVARRLGGTLLLGTPQGTVEILTVRPEGRKRMAASAWLCGTDIEGDVPWSGVS